MVNRTGKTSMKKLVIIIPILLVMTGCVPQGWVMTTSSNKTVVGTHIKVTFPNGWMQTKLPIEGLVRNKKKKIIPMETLSASRDGAGIQYIVAIKRISKFAFPSLEKHSSRNMLPSEAADLYVADLRKQIGLERLRVIKNTPAVVGRKRGFHIVSRYRNEDGLREMIDTYGFVDKTGIYLITYRGPYLYYYKRDRLAFRRSVRSFRKLKTATNTMKATGMASMFMAK